MSALPFPQLGRYRIVRELGRGAMGVVYLAQDDALHRQVAIKTLLVPDDAEESRHLEARFRQEARAAGSLNHPNTITLYDFGREGNWLYIAMELLQGEELRDRMKAGPLPLDEALDIGAQVASGLAAAHAQGVVHRDVKPGNIMVLPGGLAKIMDFGIARMQASEVRTATGTMMGSPKYMSPEQVAGHAVDHRSDIFSLGSMLHEMVTGEPAFHGENLGQLLTAITHGTPRPATEVRPGVPASVELVIARAMQKNQEARYQDAAEMARDLTHCRDAQRGRAAPVEVDLATASLPGAAPPAEAEPGLPLAKDFDSAAGLRWLLEGQGHPAPGGQAPPDRMAWWLAYAAAAVAAVAIALG